MLKGAIVGFGSSLRRDITRRIWSGDVDIVAVADICPARLEAARAVAPGARLYADWRELLARETGDRLHRRRNPAARARRNRARGR